MQNDLISKSALLEFAHNHVCGMIDCNDIARFPAIDAVPVVHAEWLLCGSDDYDAGMYYCSACKDERYFGDEVNTSEEAEKYCHYCPNCGARMDGGAE